MADENKNATYGSESRAKRATTGVLGQDVRATEGRVKQANLRGTQYNFYNDLGISTTEQGAQDIRAYEKQYNKDLSTQKGAIKDYKTGVLGQLNTAKGQLDTAAKELSSFDKIVSKVWDKTKSGFTKIAVVDKENNVEGTYYLPKEAAEGLAKEKMLYTNYLPDQNTIYIGTKSKGKGMIGGKTIGAELHEKLSGAEKEVYNKWYEQASPTLQKEYKKATGMLSGAYKTLNEETGKANTNISAAETNVKLAENKHANDWTTLKKKYNDKLAAMKNIFSTTFVKKG